MPSPAVDTNYNPFRSSTFERPAVPKDWQTLYTPEEETRLQTQIVEPEETIERSVQHYQYRGQYIVTEVRSGLMFIDQHRAHVRVLYNRYRKQLEGQPSTTQGLLFPEVVQFSMSDAPLVEEIQNELHALGFDITSLGGGSYSIQGLPSGFEGAEPRQLLVDIIDTLRESAQGIGQELHHRIALALSRRAAIPVGQVLSQNEMEDLVEKLFQLSEPNYTPDGRTIIVIYPHENLEKMFK